MTRTRKRLFWALLAGLLVPAGLAILPTVTAAFSATTTNASTWSTKALFPVYPNEITPDAPYTYLRGEDLATSSTTPAAADSQTGTPLRPGVLDGRSDDLSTWLPMNEGSGTTLQDESGAMNTGTLGSGVTWQTPGTAFYTGGKVAHFDGSANAYATTTAPAVDTSKPFTVMAWVRLADATSTHVILSQSGLHVSAFILKYQFAGWDKFQIWMPSSDANSVSSITAASTVTGSSTVGQWEHIAAAWTPGTMTLYVNGVSSSTARAANWATTDDSTQSHHDALDVGREYYASSWTTNTFSGDIADVRTYRRALSGGEIKDIYQGGLATQWDFEGNANDANGVNTGTAGAGVTYTASGHTSKGASLPGSATGYISGTTTMIRTDAPFTVSAWVNPTATTAGQIVASWNGTTNYAAALRINSAGKWAFTMPLYDGSVTSADEAASSASASAGTWTHLAATYDSLTMNLYVNGVLVGTATHRAHWNAGNPVQVGRAMTAGAYGNYFAGVVDEFRLYGRALTTAEVVTVEGGGTLGPAIGPAREAFAAQAGGALQGTQQLRRDDTSIGFGGASNLYVNTAVAAPGPTAYTIECWFKTYSGFTSTPLTGGDLASYMPTKTGPLGASTDPTDRALYMDSGGQLTFTVNPSGGKVSLRSPLAYNDGAWHYAAATQGTDGATLYIDGEPVATSAIDTASSAYAGSGYWRFGGADLTGFPNRPTDDDFTGALDEMSVYHVELSAQTILWHYHSNH